MSALEPEIVEKALNAPGQCVLTGDWDGPFIDTKRNIPWADPHAYLQVAYVEELATKLLDMVPRSELEGLEEAVKHLAEMVEERDKRLAAYETLEETKAVAA